MICIWRKKKNSGPPVGGEPPGPQRGPGAPGEQMINKLLGEMWNSMAKMADRINRLNHPAVIVDIEKWNLGVG